MSRCDPTRTPTARELRGQAGTIRALAFSPDNLHLASAGADQLVRLWSVATGELAAALRGHTQGITSLAFLPDAQTLVTASRDGTVRLWPTAPAAVESSGFTANPETRFLFSRDGRQWTAAFRDSAPLVVWDTAVRLARRKFKLSGQHVQTEGFDDAAQAVVRSLRAPDSGQIQLEWRSSDSGELRRTGVLESGFGEAWSHTFQPAMNLIALGPTKGEIRLWDTRTGRPAGQLPGHRDATVQVAFAPDGRTLASTGGDGVDDDDPRYQPRSHERSHGTCRDSEESKHGSPRNLSGSGWKDATGATERRPPHPT